MLVMPARLPQHRTANTSRLLIELLRPPHASPSSTNTLDTPLHLQQRDTLCLLQQCCAALAAGSLLFPRSSAAFQFLPTYFALAGCAHMHTCSPMLSTCTYRPKSTDCIPRNPCQGPPATALDAASHAQPLSPAPVREASRPLKSHLLLACRPSCSQIPQHPAPHGQALAPTPEATLALQSLFWARHSLSALPGACAAAGQRCQHVLHRLRGAARSERAQHCLHTETQGFGPQNVRRAAQRP